MLVIKTEPIFLQQSNQGSASFLFKGETDSDFTLKFDPIQFGEAQTISYSKDTTANTFSKTILLKAGDYKLTVSNKTGDTKTLSPVCVGEVLIFTGHSFADGFGALPESNKSAYYSTNFFEKKDEKAFDKPVDILSYRDTTSTDKRRGLAGRIASRLAEKLKVPVMMYHCSWGGTNIIQWADSAENKEVKGYAGYQLGYEEKFYPYTILKETLRKYLPQTGARGMLVIHGDNDKGNTESNLYSAYQRFLAIVRKDANFPKLAVSVSKSVNNLGNTEIINTADKVIANIADCYKGADTTPNFVTISDRYDGLHLNEVGEDKVAEQWANSLISEGFFTKTTPYTIIKEQVYSYSKLVTGNAIVGLKTIKVTALACIALISLYLIKKL